MTEWQPGDNDIAIVGLACRFPGAADVDEFWANLTAGTESIRRFDATELAALGVPADLAGHPGFVPAGAPVDDIDKFDHRFWGYSPREATLLDPQQRLLLETAWTAMEHAGHDPQNHDGLVGVYAGMGMSTYLLYRLLGSPDVSPSDTQIAMLGNDKDFLSTRISYHMNLRGPSLAVQTGCSTSLVATHLACEGLLSYQCDVALAGGASVVLPERTGYVHYPNSTASSDGHCRAFDAKGDGTVFGSGVGVVVLKRIEDALAAGDTVYAVIKGSAVNNDGANRVGFTAPSVEGQAEVIARAQRVAEVDAATVTYIEAHGTATEFGDPVEVAALSRVFRQSTDATGFCALGSVKTNIGHLDAAAGIAGLIKTALALHHRKVPPSLHFEQPNPQIDFEYGPFYVNTTLTGWASGPTPRRAGVSAFGFGGTNAHVVLEEAPIPQPAANNDSPQVLVLSAKTGTALDTATEELAHHLRTHPDQRLMDVAYTLQQGRTVFGHRRAVVCRDRDDALAVLGNPDPPRVRTRDESKQDRPVAFMFAGLGDQYAGMAADLYLRQPVFRETVDRCAELLHPLLGVDVRQVLYPERDEQPAGGTPIDFRAMIQGVDPASEIADTALAHPALFVVEYALAQLWMSWGVRPSALIGHSLGEYVAATVAGVFALPDALRLVAERARLIGELPAAAMLAVSCAATDMRGLIGDQASVALINGPQLTVLAGGTTDIDAVARRFEDRAVPVRRLRVQHAFHSAAMQPIVAPLTELLRTIPLSPPAIAFPSNVTGTWITAQQATDPAYWAGHSAAPVRFAEGIEALCAGREQVLLELGPGQSLSALAAEHVARHDLGAGTVIIPSLRAAYDRRHDNDTTYLLDVLAQMWLAGAKIAWPAVHQPAEPRRVPLPTYPFERQRHMLAPAGTSGVTKQLETGRRDRPGEWFLAPCWRSIPLPQQHTGSDWPTSENWLLFADETGLAKALAAQATKTGHAVTVVEPGERFECNGDRWQLPDRVIHLASLGVGEDLPSAGFHSLLALAKALSRHTDQVPVDLWIVSDGLVTAHQTDVVHPAKAMMLGAAKCIPQEYAGISVHCVDFGGTDPGHEQRAGQLMDAIAEQPEERLLAYRGDRRWVQTFEPLPLTRVRTPLRRQGCYVVTGGLGSIGLTVAEYLAEQVQARIVLIGRSAFPAVEQWPQWLADKGTQDDTSRKILRLQALRDLGAQVVVYSADVADPDRMRAVFEQVRDRFADVDGVIHAAGIVGVDAFSPIDELDQARTEKVLRAKVTGTRVLAEALVGQQPDFVLLLSSNAAVLGGLGTSAYTAGSIFLDSFAQTEAGSGGRWISVDMEDWLPDSGQGKPTTSITRYGLTVPEGLQVLRQIVECAPAGQVTVVTGDLEQRLDRWVRHPEVARQARGPAGGPRQPRPDLTSGYQPPDDEVEAAIAEVWQEMLGIDRVGRDDDFYELGGHSLLATQIVTRVRSAYEVELSLLSLLRSPTVAGLAGHVRDNAGKATGQTIAVVSRDQPLPLSYGQRRFWFIDQLVPGNPVYTIADVARLEGPLRIDLLRLSINDIVARHETLRGCFEVGADGEPVQRILPELHIDVPFADLRDLPPDVRREHWQELARAEARKPFDLAEPPLIRATVLRVDKQEHILLLTMHHSVCDAWATGVFIRELGERYAAHSAGDPAPPEPLPVQYADFAVWQRQQLQGESRGQLLEYWREHLAGAPPLVQFPLDHPRPVTQSFQGAGHPIHLSAQLVQQLRQLAGREGCTLFMTLLTAFNCLLYRYSGEDDLVVGTPIAGRQRPEVENIIGVFVNMLPLRVKIDPRQGVRELLGRIREVTLGAFAHQDLPFELLVEDLRPDRDLGRGQIFQNVLVLQNAPLPPLELAGLRIAQVPMPATTAKFDLMIMLRETGDGATGEIEYAADLFTAGTVARIGRHFVRLLEQLVADPDLPVGDLSFLTAGEYALVTAEWAAGPALPAEPGCVPDLFSAQAAATPDAPAVLASGDPASTLSFGQVEARSNQVARYLRDRGIGRETRVAVCMDRTTETVALLLGIMKAGAAYVPLDPAYPVEWLRFVVRDAGVDLVVTEDRYRERLDAPGSDTVSVTELWAGCAQLAGTPVGHRVDPRDPAYVLYTSGSTGWPKGVTGLHGGMANRLRWMWREYPFGPGEVLCQKTSLSFLDSFWEMFGPLCQGVAVVVIPPALLTDPQGLVRVLAAHAVTRIVLVPSLLKSLLDNVSDLARQLPALRFWVTSGEALTAGLAGRLLAASPDYRLLNLYGSSEVSADVTHHMVTPADVADGTVPIGRPIAETSVYLLDETMRPVPAGVDGDLYVGGISLARGYVAAPGLTADRFVPDPFGKEPGGRLYRTGDKARYRTDGTVVYTGRRDHQLKVRGFRIEPAEVERAVSRHPSVGQVVVTAEDDVLVAYCVPIHGQDIHAGAIHHDLRTRLPHYMIPAVFVPCASLPLTPSGKIDRSRLRRAEHGTPRPQAAKVPPVTPAEQALAELWREVLGTPAEIGVHDNFWFAGGHSLLATRFITRVREAFGTTIPLDRFFADPTIAGVVDILQSDPARAAEIGRRAQIVLRVAALSDAEVQLLLSENTVVQGADHDSSA